MVLFRINLALKKSKTLTFQASCRQSTACKAEIYGPRCTF